MKNNASDKVSRVALIILTQNFWVGQNAQNTDFPKSTLYNIRIKVKGKAKTTAKKSTPGFRLAAWSCMKNQANSVRLFIFVHAFKAL